VRGVGIPVEMIEIEIVIVIVIVMSGIVEQLRDVQIQTLDDDYEWVLDLSYAVYRASPQDEHHRASHKTSKTQNRTMTTVFSKVYAYITNEPHKKKGSRDPEDSPIR
jgi:hypothetical protein